MRCVLAFYGTRGDVEPGVAVARELACHDKASLTLASRDTARLEGLAATLRHECGATVAVSSMSYTLCIAVSKQADPMLLGILNSAVNALSARQIENLAYNNTMLRSEDVSLASLLRRYPMQALSLAGIVVLLLLAILFTMLRARQTRLRTARLHEQRMRLALAQGAASGGALQIDVFAGGTLGRNPTQQLKLVTDGIADIALYAYTCVAPHGGIRLDAYPALRDWLARVEATPGFVPLPAPDAAAQALIDQSS